MATTTLPTSQRRKGLRRPVLAAAVAVSTLAGCGPDSSATADPHSSDTAVTAADDAIEPATVPGLAAAVLDHLQERRVERRGGTSNDYEGWMAVEFAVRTDRGAVPVSVMVMRADEELDLSEFGACPTDKTVLHCRVDRAPDGSPVLAQTSNEDIVGGISRDGLFVFVGHARHDHMVLVVEELPSRRKSYVTMTGLPVPLKVLTAIATDPHVGTTTTRDLNDAGRELPEFAQEEKR